MQLSKLLIPAAAAAALLIGSAAQAAVGGGPWDKYWKPVRNPSGGVIGQSPNNPTGATYFGPNTTANWGGTAPQPVRNPSGGVIGQPPNHPTGQTSGWGPTGSSRAVRNPSGGVIGQPPNHATAGTVAYVGNIGVGGAPNNFPTNPARHRDTSHGDLR